MEWLDDLRVDRSRRWLLGKNRFDQSQSGELYSNFLGSFSKSRIVIALFQATLYCDQPAGKR